MGRVEHVNLVEKRERTANLPVITPAEIATGYAYLLRRELSLLHLNDTITVSDEISYRRADEYQHVLTLGILGDIELSTATLAATNSLQNVSENGMPVHTLFFPPEENGLSLKKDEESKTFWAQEFYVCENNVFKRIKTDRPVPIDAVLTTQVDDKSEEDEALFPGRKKLQTLTQDKWQTHEVLVKSGIPVPDSLFLSANDTETREQALQLISQASPDGFVVKATTGSQGSYVRMFDEVSKDAIAYASQLQADGKDIILQSRIIPHPLFLPDGEAIPPDQVDHNLRVLVTIGEDPTILDAEIRYSEKSGNPVNVSRGANALKSRHLLRSLPPDMLFTMYDTSIQAAKALYEATEGEIYDAVGYIGLDVIIDQEGVPYIIEANYGNVGGLGTLSRLTEVPVEAVSDKLLTSAEPVLMAHHAQRLAKPRGYLESLPLQDIHKVALSVMYYYSGHEEKAEALMADHHWEMDYAEVHTLRGLKAAATGDYERAIKELGHSFLYKEAEVEITMGLVDSLRQAGYANIGAGLLDYYFKNLNAKAAHLSYDRAYFEYQMTGDPQRALELLSAFQDLPRAKLQPYEQKLRLAMQQTPSGLSTVPQANREFLTRDEFVERFLALTNPQPEYEEFGSYAHFLYKIYGGVSAESVKPWLLAIKEIEGITVDEELSLGLLIAHQTVEDMVKNHSVTEEQKQELWTKISDRLIVQTAQRIQNQLPEKKVKKSITTAQYFAIRLGELRLQEALEAMKDPAWNLKEKGGQLTGELYRTYLYPTLDCAITYLNLDADIAEHIADIDFIFDSWQYPESSLYRSIYTLRLQDQLGVEFAQDEIPAVWLQQFEIHDEQLIREKLREATKGMKKTKQKKRAITEQQRENYGLGNVLARYETFVRGHLQAVFNQTLSSQYDEWVAKYGEEKAALIPKWLIEDTVMTYLEFMPAAMLDILTQETLENIGNIKREILQNQFATD